jgi:hypothetical protein
MPLLIYGFLTVLSAIFSDNRSFSFFGGFEHFESVFAIVGYCITVIYIYFFINSEVSIKKIILFILIQAIGMVVLGISQLIGHDFLISNFAHNLILPLEYRLSELSSNFGVNRVYLTLFNPNYVGSYVSLIAPILLILFTFQKKLINKIIYGITCIGLLICAIGSQSFTGVIGLTFALLFAVIIFYNSIFKRQKLLLMLLFIISIMGFITFNLLNDNFLINKFSSLLDTKKHDYELSDIFLNKDNIKIRYNRIDMNLEYYLDDQTVSILLYDEDNQIIPNAYDNVSNTFKILDDRFAGLSIGISDQYPAAIYVREGSNKWTFTNVTEDGSYYYINDTGKLDKIITAPSLLFDGYENFASNRGYIWSRTLPLIKNNIIIGTGPDNYIFEFPQRDYLNIKRMGFGNSILTKPHNMYLQIAIQTGFLSLLAFLTFYIIYFISSFRLYIKAVYNDIYSQLGVAIFIGTMAYMITGLANDSSITVAPIFWVLIGTGIVINSKLKQLLNNKVN